MVWGSFFSFFFSPKKMGGGVQKNCEGVQIYLFIFFGGLLTVDGSRFSIPLVCRSIFQDRACGPSLKPGSLAGVFSGSLLHVGQLRVQDSCPQGRKQVWTRSKLDQQFSDIYPFLSFFIDVAKVWSLTRPFSSNPADCSSWLASHPSWGVSTPSSLLPPPYSLHTTPPPPPPPPPPQTQKKKIKKKK